VAPLDVHLREKWIVVHCHALKRKKNNKFYFRCDISEKRKNMFNFLKEASVLLGGIAAISAVSFLSICAIKRQPNPRARSISLKLFERGNSGVVEVKRV
jgi:hypothetical protein